MMRLTTRIYNSSLHFIYAFIKQARKKRKFKHALGSNLDNNKTAKLHIGCGGTIMEGWLNVDFEHIKSGAYFMDASHPFHIPSSTFDYIYSEHLFEHLNLDGQLNMLNESYRILNENTVMRIATPNGNATPKTHNMTCQCSSHR